MYIFQHGVRPAYRILKVRVLFFCDISPNLAFNLRPNKLINATFYTEISFKSTAADPELGYDNVHDYAIYRFTASQFTDEPVRIRHD